MRRVGLLSDRRRKASHNCNLNIELKSIHKSSPFAHIFLSNLVPSEAESLQIRRAIEECEASLDRLSNGIAGVNGTLLLLDRNHVPRYSERTKVPFWRRVKRWVDCRSSDVVEMDSQVSYQPSSSINTEVARARLLLQELLSDRDRLRWSLEAHKALLSPMRRLPAELWSEIFSLCLPDEPFLCPAAEQAPLVLCQICHAWRQVAVSTPIIWSSLSLNVYDGGLSPAQASLATAWLTRSGASPLSLEISWYPVNSPMDPFFDITLSHFSRLRHLRIFAPGSSLERILNNPTTPLPWLRSLQLIAHADVSIANHFTVSQSATALRSLTIPTIYLNPLDLHMPWEQLTNLRSHYCLNVGHALDLIAQCPNLLDCTLRILCWRGSDAWVSINQIVLPNLCTLSITSEHCDQFIDHLTLPSLRSIAITVVGGHGFQTPHWPKESLLRLRTRSSCPLERLTIRETPTSEDDLLHFLRIVPSVMDIVAVVDGRSQITDRVLKTLTSRQSANKA